MLDRAAPPAARAARQRQQQRAWQRTYRRRQRDGVRLVEVTLAVVELAIAGEWLSPEEAEDKRAIAQALDALAKASLKTFR
jgi:hypothetical protein